MSQVSFTTDNVLVAGDGNNELLFGGVASQLPVAWQTDASPLHLGRLGLYESARLQLDISASDFDDTPQSGHEINADVAAALRIRVDRGNDSLTVVGIQLDETEPYNWRPSNFGEVHAFATSLAPGDTCTVTLTDPNDTVATFLNRTVPFVEPTVPALDLAGRLDVLLPQYGDARRLRSLLTEVIGIVQSEIVDPLVLLDRAFNPDAASGVLLDWLGTRIGMPRPYVRSSDARYFGFGGTEPAGGRTFGQAPFFTTRALIEDVEPVNDQVYRPLIRARARRLRGGANRETLEAILAILWPDGGGFLNESGSVLGLTVNAPDRDLLFELASGSQFERLFPRPGGRAMVLVRQLALLSGTIDGRVIVLQYNQTLDAASVPTGGDFTVRNDGAIRSISSVQVVDSTVRITQQFAATAGQTVLLSYAAGNRPIRSAAGQNAANLTNRAITNITT